MADSVRSGQVRPISMADINAAIDQMRPERRSVVRRRPQRGRVRQPRRHLRRTWRSTCAAGGFDDLGAGDQQRQTRSNWRNTYMEARNYRRAEEVLRSALLHNPHDATLLDRVGAGAALAAATTAPRSRALERAGGRARSAPTRCGSTRRSSMSWGVSGRRCHGRGERSTRLRWTVRSVRVRQDPAQRGRCGGCAARGDRGLRLRRTMLTPTT